MRMDFAREFAGEFALGVSLTNKGALSCLYGTMNIWF